MTAHELALMVRNMREAQSKYFKDRNPSQVGIARDWERRVDKAVVEILDPPTTGLFEA